VNNVVDLFLPDRARSDETFINRARGIIKSLLVISLVVAVLFTVYLVVIPAPPPIEIGLFAACFIFPILGAWLFRLTGNVMLCMTLSNLSGFLIVLIWAAMSGGVMSPAMPWMLGLMATVVSFGNWRYITAIGAFVMLSSATLFVLTGSSVMPPSFMEEKYVPLYFALSYTSASLLIALAALVVLRERARTKMRFANAKDEAVQANRAKDVFLSSMSHELRTPLNAVIGFSEVLANDPDAPLTENQARYVAHIQNAGEHLVSLINQILEMSRLESGAMELDLTGVAPQAAVHTVSDMLTPQAAKRSVTIFHELEESLGRFVRADPTRLNQVLINLISNAIKYNSDGGCVRVRVIPVLDREAQPCMRFSVIDSGPGIANGAEADLFKPFARLGAEGSNVEGSGLGLSISRKLVSMMGGTIGFRRPEEGGSEFWFELKEDVVP
jgi:signal transduction histidine kinase